MTSNTFPMEGIEISSVVEVIPGEENGASRVDYWPEISTVDQTGDDPPRAKILKESPVVECNPCVNLVSDDDDFSASTESDGETKPKPDDSLQKSVSREGTYTSEGSKSIATDELIRIRRDSEKCSLDYGISFDSADNKWRVVFPSRDEKEILTLKSSSLEKIEDVLKEQLTLLQEDLTAYKNMLQPGWKCQACWQVIPSYKVYVAHISVCPVVCPLCRLLFTSEQSQIMHLKYCRTTRLSKGVVCNLDKGVECSCVMCS